MSWSADTTRVVPTAFNAAVDSLEVPLYGTPEEIKGQRAQVAVAKQAAKLLAASLGVSPGQLVYAVIHGHFQGSAEPKSGPSSVGVSVYAVEPA